MIFYFLAAIMGCVFLLPCARRFKSFGRWRNSAAQILAAFKWRIRMNSQVQFRIFLLIGIVLIGGVQVRELSLRSGE
jgi:hypothetical protein